MLPDTFQSPTRLRATFTAGLRRLLDDGGLGAYILVLANAVADPELFHALRDDLLTGFEQQCRAFDHACRDGSIADWPPDDVAVFAKLRKLGLTGLGPAQFRPIGPWRAQFNPLRALRPPRNADAVITRVSAAFDPTAFNFNKPFLRKESIWVGELLGRPVDLMYNKFPFIDLHGLLVPEREAGLPQYLTAAEHDYIWRLAEALGPALPGIGFGYNAYGAYSSINHLHVQTFIQRPPLPVELPVWQHGGGARPYPSQCRVFTDSGAAYAFIERLHGAGITYNLLYRPGRVYCLPRRFQGSYRHAGWSGGYAWCELCGSVTTFAAAQFAALDEAAVLAEFDKLALAV